MIVMLATASENFARRVRCCDYSHQTSYKKNWSQEEHISSSLVISFLASIGTAIRLHLGSPECRGGDFRGYHKMSKKITTWTVENPLKAVIRLSQFVCVYHMNRCKLSTFSRGLLGNMAVSGQRRRCNVPVKTYLLYFITIYIHTFSPASGRI